MENNNPIAIMNEVSRRKPDATAAIQGSADYPNVRGRAFFYQVNDGTLAVIEANGLPLQPGGACAASVYGVHIHQGGACTGTPEDPFADAGEHYNPLNCSHPQHAGDLPPLMGNDGYAWNAVLTDRFLPQEVEGRTLIIHSAPDDFTTQPAGNAGVKIACGVIQPSA